MGPALFPGRHRKGSAAILLLQCPGADRKAPSPGSSGREAEVAGQEAGLRLLAGKISLLHFPMRYTSLDKIHKEVYA